MVLSRDVVVQYLHLLLEGAVLETTTENSLRSELQTYFSQDLSPFEQLIKVWILFIFMMRLAATVQPAGRQQLLCQLGHGLITGLTYHRRHSSRAPTAIIT